MTPISSEQNLQESCHTLRQEVARLKDRLAEMVREAENRSFAELIIDNSPVILFRRLAAERLEDRKMIYVSPNVARFGYTADDFLTNRIMFRDIVHPEDTERTKAEIADYVKGNIDAYTQIYRILTRNGEPRWIEDHTSVIEDPNTDRRYHQGIVVDIHLRKEAEDRLRRSEEKYRRIVETTSEGFLLMEKDLCIVDTNPAFCRMTGYSPEALIGKRLDGLLVEKFRFQLSTWGGERFEGVGSVFDAEIASADGASVPVVIHGNTLHDDAKAVIGTMAFVTDMTEHKKALRLAGEVQRSLLPQNAPPHRGIDIAAGNLTCDEVGGDYYDFFVSTDAAEARFSVAIGDSSGHGVDSALMMTTARAFLRMRASQPGDGAEIVSAMNRHFTDAVRNTGQFMTLVYVTIDVDERWVEWVRAGHDPAWLYDPGEDRFEALEGPGIALGVDAAYVYRLSRRTDIQHGQILVLGTDGIWEGRNKAGEMFGKERLLSVVRRHAGSSPKAILDAAFQEHRVFTRDSRPEDDLTLVIVKLTR